VASRPCHFWREIMSAEQFIRMTNKINSFNTGLNAEQVRHACNLISNYLRSAKFDFYEVEVSSAVFDYNNESGYFDYFVVSVDGVNLYVKVVVD